MSVSNELRGSVRVAFEALIDYAGLFPPAKLAMAQAVDAYMPAQKGPQAWMLGRFIVPASRIGELRGAALPLCVILDVELDPRGWFGAAGTALGELAGLRERDPSLRIEALEVPLAPLLTRRETFDASIGQLGALLDRAGFGDLPAYVELPAGSAAGELLAGAMAALARARLGAKLRCGGVTADAFPSVEAVAAFIASAAVAGVPFKATAGLHHPVRHYNAPSGFTMHGFLNVLAAATFAPRVDFERLTAIVAEEDPAAFGFDAQAFSWRDERADIAELQRTRGRAFAAYGSCSFSEPVEDLVALGILERNG